MAIAGQPTEQAVLDGLVTAARALAGAQYAAGLFVGPDGALTALAHQGLTTGQVAGLPHLPRPVWLVGVVLTGQTLRLTRMDAHPDSVGFAEGYVPMEAFLGTPINSGGRVVGGVYLTRSPGQPDFDDHDEAVAVALADQAGTAVTALRAAAATSDLLDGLRLTTERAGDPAGNGTDHRLSGGCSPPPGPFSGWT